MGRKVRRVPADWQHPTNEEGNYIPMHERFPYNDEEIAEGLSEGWLDAEAPHYGIAVMPAWPAEVRTHYQMYEDTTEGTPISPVMDSPEALARWLADTGASAFADMPASYEHWLRVCRGGYAPSMVMDQDGIRSGVEGFNDD